MSPHRRPRAGSASVRSAKLARATLLQRKARLPSSKAREPAPSVHEPHPQAWPLEVSLCLRRRAQIVWAATAADPAVKPPAPMRPSRAKGHSTRKAKSWRCHSASPCLNIPVLGTTQLPNPTQHASLCKPAREPPATYNRVCLIRAPRQLRFTGAPARAVGNLVPIVGI